MTVPTMGAFVAAGVVVSNCAYACAYAANGRKSVRPMPRERDPWEDERDEQPEDRGRHGYWGH